MLEKGPTTERHATTRTTDDPHSELIFGTLCQETAGTAHLADRIISNVGRSEG